MVVTAGGAHAASVRPASGQTQSWAYEQSTAFTCSGLACGVPSNPNATITASAHFYIGAVVIYTQTNNSPVYWLTLEKVLYVYASAQVTATCLQNCGNLPAGTTVTGNGTFTALYQGYANANVTTNAQVFASGLGAANGSYVPAIGLQDASSSQSANATGTFSLSGGPFSGPGPAAFAELTAKAQASFSPALGLVPDQLYGGEVWTSASNYTASASGSAGYHYYVPCSLYQALNATATCTNNAGTYLASIGASVPSAAPITLSGEDYGPVSVTNNYGTYNFQVITLAFSGALATTDGIFLVPSNVGSFVGALSPTHLFSSHIVGQAASSPSITVVPPDGLDYATGSGRVGFSGGNIAGAASAYTAMGMGSSGPIPTSVAQSDASGYISGTAPAKSGFAWLLPLVVLVVVVLVIVGAVLYMRSRKRPPTATPAAAPVTGAPASGNAAPGAYGSWPPSQPGAAQPQAPPAQGAPPAYR